MNHMIDGDNGKDPRSPYFMGPDPEPEMIACVHCGEPTPEYNIREFYYFGNCIDKCCPSCYSALVEEFTERLKDEMEEV